MDHNIKKIINHTIQVLNDGGSILYPTETIWGIGCDATNVTAIKKIYKIKKRAQTKKLIILVDSIRKLNLYLKKVPPIAYKLIKESKKPTTIIYNNPINLPEILTHNNTIGIRVIKNHDVNIILKHFNKAITSTSANISSYQNPMNFSEIDDHIKNNVDYIVPINLIQTQQTKKPSSIIKINNDGSIKMIRN
tara:strand:- start:1259 stop:1834 length:576 start_codon:yes stop_codon:yes gene_type:complete